LRQDPKTRALIARAKESAMVLPEDVSTLWQRAKVQDFFIRAGAALVALKDRAAAEARERETGGRDLGDQEKTKPGGFAPP
jgi:hypothetical protein